MRRILLPSLVAVVVFGLGVQAQNPAKPARARDLGVPFDGTPGAFNAITDVRGVLVGHTTLVEGDGAKAIRTGVTAMLPRASLGYYPAATFILNGDTELRAALGLARNGATANPGSSDAVVAFATTPVQWDKKQPYLVRGENIFPHATGHLYLATVQATEEAVINALVAAQTMTGLHGSKVYALPHDRLREAMRRYNRLSK